MKITQGAYPFICIIYNVAKNIHFLLYSVSEHIRVSCIDRMLSTTKPTLRLGKHILACVYPCETLLSQVFSKRKQVGVAAVPWSLGNRVGGNHDRSI